MFKHPFTFIKARSRFFISIALSVFLCVAFVSIAVKASYLGGPSSSPVPGINLKVDGGQAFIDKMATINGGSNWDAVGLLVPNGNVGIGALVPATKLEVQKDNTDTDLGQILVSGATNPSKRITLGFQTSGDYGFISAYSNTADYKNIVLAPNGGNVGINNTSPIAKLVVNNSTTDSGSSADGILSAVDTSGYAIKAVQLGAGLGSAIYAFSNSAGSAIKAQQNNASGYAISASGQSYFAGDVHIGTQTGIYKVNVAGDVSITGDILNDLGRPLLSSEFLNSDIHGNQVWTNDVLTINDADATLGWHWANNQFLLSLPKPALGFRLRGSSDNSGLCHVEVDNMFAADITKAGWMPRYDLSGYIPLGGYFSGFGSGNMESMHNTFLFGSIQSGEHINQYLYDSSTGGYTYDTAGDCYSNCDPVDLSPDQVGYIKPVGLDIIPAGRSVLLRGGRYNGGGPGSIQCHLDVLYADEYQPQ